MLNHFSGVMAGLVPAIHVLLAQPVGRISHRVRPLAGPGDKLHVIRHPDEEGGLRLRAALRMLNLGEKGVDARDNPRIKSGDGHDDRNVR